MGADSREPGRHDGDERCTAPFHQGQRVRWVEHGDAVWDGLEGEVLDVIEDAFAEVVVQWPDPIGTTAHGERSFPYMRAWTTSHEWSVHSSEQSFGRG
jgi:hypothetical protein